MGRHKGIPDEALLKQAREVFVEEGVNASTKEIARRAGVSEAAIFQRFHTKRELMIAALGPAAFDPAAVLQFAKAPGDVRMALEHFGRRLRGYFREQIPCGMLLMTSGVRPDEFMAGQAVSPMESFTQALAEFLGAAVKRGEADTANPFAAAGLFVAAIHSLVIFELAGGHGKNHGDKALEAFTHALWSGLAPRKD